MKHYFSIFLISIMLTGCYNIGSYSYYVQNTPSVVSSAEQKTAKNNCELYIPLAYSAIPELPLGDIKTAQLKNDKLVNTILVSYIRELRQYTVARRVEDAAHYNRYLIQCVGPLK